MAWRSAAVAAVLAACGPITGVPFREDAGEDPSISASSSGTSSAETGVAACELPTLADFTIGLVFIDTGTSPDIGRGTSRKLRLSTTAVGLPERVDACVTWSILPLGGAPAGAATIDAEGVVYVEPETPIGMTYQVTADIEDGRRILTVDVMVYEPVRSPVVGTWVEVSRLPCDGGPAYVPDDPVGELIFLDSGEFRVTWTPQEAYVDYWGAFLHSPQTGALNMTPSGGNSTPIDRDGVGIATVGDDGVLELREVFLGTRPGSNPVLACGHRLE